MFQVFRFRVKSKNGLLNQMAESVNAVWNFCNDTQKFAIKWNKPWLSGFDLIRLTTGTSKELRIPSHTVSAVCLQYAKVRKQHNRPYLRYRGKRSLKWIPIQGRDLKLVSDGIFKFYGN